jgi:hypothetical protein
VHSALPSTVGRKPGNGFTLGQNKLEKRLAVKCNIADREAGSIAGEIHRADGKHGMAEALTLGATLKIRS